MLAIAKQLDQHCKQRIHVFYGLDKLKEFNCSNNPFTDVAAIQVFKAVMNSNSVRKLIIQVHILFILAYTHNNNYLMYVNRMLN